MAVSARHTIVPERMARDGDDIRQEPLRRTKLKVDQVTPVGGRAVRAALA